MPLGFRFAGTATASQGRSAANDNPPHPTGQDFGRRVLLREALHHFAAHGADAAELAYHNAEQAFFAGRRRDYLHWMAICRALDRRLVDAAGAAPPQNSRYPPS